jgi:hypothetical protein
MSFTCDSDPKSHPNPTTLTRVTSSSMMPPEEGWWWHGCQQGGWIPEQDVDDPYRLEENA